MASIDEDLSQIERDLRTLKIEYEQYFGGGRKRPPADTQWRIESLIRRHSERIGDLSYGQRFRYNNLTQTYAKYQDMWRKKLAQKETGAQQRHFGAAAKAIAAERARTRHRRNVQGGIQEVGREAEAGDAVPASASQEHRTGRKPGSGPQRHVEELYQELLRAHEQAGDKAVVPSLQDFTRFVEQKTRDLEKKGAQRVEFTVRVEQGRAKLKARVLNEGSH
jgi:hypothetical protein